MDTKWKKSKMIVGAVSHVLGISLLLSALLFNPYVLFWDVPSDIGVILSSDGRYEQTQDFRDYVSRMTNNLLRIGASKPISDGIFEYAYRPGWLSGLFGSATITAETILTVEKEPILETQILQEEVAVEEADTAGVTEGRKYPVELYRTEVFGQEEEGKWSQKELDEVYDGFLKNHAEDKNLLYQVSFTDSEGKARTYTNAEGEAIGGEKNLLPDGYSFLLKFDQDRAFAWLDGEELDLYGDGIYRWDGTQWAIPGYENYALSKDYKRSQVTIAVRRVPMRYVIDDVVYGDSLYGAQHSFSARKRAFILWAAALAASLVLLAVSFWLRRERREVCRRLGRALGNIYVEGICVMAAFLFECVFFAGIRPVFRWGNSIFWWGNGTDWMALYVSVLLFFWLLYLLWLYLRYGQNPWKKSLFAKLIISLRKKERAMDIQNRLNGRILRSISCMLFGIAAALVGALLPWRAAVACWVIAAAVFAAGTAFAVYNACCQHRLSRDLGLLNDQINAAWEGKERAVCALPTDSDLAGMAEKVAGIRNGLETAVEERMKSERMKVELVANVSHDIKTPLTSIISYVELLKEDESLPEELKDYVAILSQKSERLKEMVQDVFEVSKASSGQLPVNPERLDLAKLLRQTMADMQEQIANAPVHLRAQIPEEAVEIVADGQRLYRVFQNLLQNALQYSLEGSRIYVRLEKEGSLVVASVQNTSRSELDSGTDFTERFVRGDVSRTDSGSGLGLSIAKSFTEACGGTFAVETIADLFVATVRFELA